MECNLPIKTMKLLIQTMIRINLKTHVLSETGQTPKSCAYCTIPFMLSSRKGKNTYRKLIGGYLRSETEKIDYKGAEGNLEEQ